MTSRRQMRCAGEPGGAARQLVPGRAYADFCPGAFTTPEVEEGEPAGIVKKSLTNPEQFERSPANAKPAWLLISRVSGRDGRDDITGVPHESPSCSERSRRHLRVLQPGPGPLRRDRPQTRTGHLAEGRAAPERQCPGRARSAHLARGRPDPGR